MPGMEYTLMVSIQDQTNLTYVIIEFNEEICGINLKKKV
jgi:hypothetical protein